MLLGDQELLATKPNLVSWSVTWLFFLGSISCPFYYQQGVS